MMDSQKFFKIAMTTLVVLIIITFSVGTYFTHQNSPKEQKAEVSTLQDNLRDKGWRQGIIKADSIVAVDNEAFMKLSHFIAQKNIIEMMLMEHNGEAFIVHAPARCRYSDSILYDGVVMIVIEEGEHDLKGGLTWKIFVY